MTAHKIDNNERQKHHAQERELVRSSEQLGELHCWSSVIRWRENTETGSRPVLAAKRWESEGILPSGRSSSIRSIRCVGKKTTPGETCSPSFTIETRSSNEASSIPHRDTPSGLSESNTPQNFSRGLPSVSTTIVRGRKGFSPRTNGVSRSSRFFTEEIVAGEGQTLQLTSGTTSERIRFPGPSDPDAMVGKFEVCTREFDFRHVAGHAARICHRA